MQPGGGEGSVCFDSLHFVLIAVCPILRLNRCHDFVGVTSHRSETLFVYIGRSSDFRYGFVCPQSFARGTSELVGWRDSAVAKPLVRNFVDAIPRGRRYTCRICTSRPDYRFSRCICLSHRKPAYTRLRIRDFDNKNLVDETFERRKRFVVVSKIRERFIENINWKRARLRMVEKGKNIKASSNAFHNRNGRSSLNTERGLGASLSLSLSHF